MAQVIKAAIVTVGTFQENGHPLDWVFDCSNGAAGISFSDDFEIRWGGYTLDELKAIANPTIQ